MIYSLAGYIIIGCSLSSHCEQRYWSNAVVRILAGAFLCQRRKMSCSIVRVVRGGPASLKVEVCTRTMPPSSEAQAWIVKWLWTVDHPHQRRPLHSQQKISN
jgi:hypothetical protein